MCPTMFFRNELIFCCLSRFISPSVHLFQLPLVFNTSTNDQLNNATNPLLPKATNSNIWFINEFNKQKRITENENCYTWRLHNSINVYIWWFNPKINPINVIHNVYEVSYYILYVYSLYTRLYVDQTVLLDFLLKETMQTMPLTTAYSLVLWTVRMKSKWKKQHRSKVITTITKTVYSFHT